MQAFDKYVHSNGRYGLKKFYPSLKITLKWLQGITLCKDFETMFAFLLNSLTDHYSGQILVRLVVFLRDDELIFLLLFETMISQACILILRPPKPFNVSNFLFFLQLSRSFLIFVSLFVFLVRSDPHL